MSAENGSTPGRKPTDLDDREKGLLRNAVQRGIDAQEQLKQMQLEVARRAAHVEAVVHTVVSLRGLNPDRYQLSYDLRQDRFELIEVVIPNLPMKDGQVDREAAAKLGIRFGDGETPNFPSAPGD